MLFLGSQGRLFCGASPPPSPALVFFPIHLPPAKPASSWWLVSQSPVCSQALSPPDSPKRPLHLFPLLGTPFLSLLAGLLLTGLPSSQAAPSSLQRVPLSGLEPAQGHSPQWHLALSVSIFLPGLLSACHHLALFSIESSVQVRPAGLHLVCLSSPPSASQGLPVPPQCIA